MKGTMRMWVFSTLLTVMLVSVVMVPAMATLTTPPADAEEQIKTNLLFQEQKAEKNIYAMLGVEQPSRDDGPQWQKYNEARAQVDELLIRSESKESVREIIGYLEGEKERVVLYYGTDGGIYGILDNQGRVSQSRVDPVVVGSKTEYFENGCKACSVGNQSDSYSINYELSKISLSDLESEEFDTRAIYEAQITRTDDWIWRGNPLLPSKATLYTQGTFTYDYGNSILSISDNTHTSQDPGFDRCEFGHSTRENGYTGYIDSHVIWSVFALSPPKHSVDAWISCNKYGSTDGNSNTSDWVSVGFACGSLP